MQREYLILKIEDIERYMNKEDMILLDNIIRRFEKDKANKIHEREELSKSLTEGKSFKGGLNDIPIGSKPSKPPAQTQKCKHLNKRPIRRANSWTSRDEWEDICCDCGKFLG